MWLTRGSGLDDVSCDGCTSLIPTGPVQCEGSAIPRNKRFSRRAWGSLGRQTWPHMSQGGTSTSFNKKADYIKDFECPTFSRPSSDVGFHFRPVSECFGPDAEVIGDAVSQVFYLHPQGSTALHIYCHYLTDTWSARRGVCTENTKTLDAAFYKRQIAKLCAHEQTHRLIQTNSWVRR